MGIDAKAFSITFEQWQIAVAVFAAVAALTTSLAAALLKADDISNKPRLQHGLRGVEVIGKIFAALGLFAAAIAAIEPRHLAFTLAVGYLLLFAVLFGVGALRYRPEPNQHAAASEPPDSGATEGDVKAAYGAGAARRPASRGPAAPRPRLTGRRRS